MSEDKLTQTLVQALKQGLTEGGEQRLFRSGKLPGLFAGKAGLNAEAAAQAVRDGLLEITRTETKGKTATEWAKVTPRGVEFVQAHESPIQALRDLHSVLRMTQDGLPVWVADLKQDLVEAGERVAAEAQRISRQIDVLSRRVEEALARAQAGGPGAKVDVAAIVPWGPAALQYLDKRKETGVVNHCAMPELFAALREKHVELTLTDFHGGLRRMHDRGLVRLLPFEGPDGLPEPEYALLDGAATFYHVAR